MNSLESPCLPHIDVASPNSSTSETNTFTSTGHVLTVSACLLHNHPSLPGQRQFSPTAWEVPQASIDQLLALSNSVPLQDGEVTPVQAWDYIRRQKQFAGLEVGRWESLKEARGGFVRCYGFGGVVEREAFENAVSITVLKTACSVLCANKSSVVSMRSHKFDNTTNTANGLLCFGRSANN